MNKEHPDWKKEISNEELRWIMAMKFHNEVIIPGIQTLMNTVQAIPKNVLDKEDVAFHLKEWQSCINSIKSLQEETLSWNLRQFTVTELSNMIIDSAPEWVKIEHVLSKNDRNISFLNSLVPKILEELWRNYEKYWENGVLQIMYNDSIYENSKWSMKMILENDIVEKNHNLKSSGDGLSWLKKWLKGLWVHLKWSEKWWKFITTISFPYKI